MDYRWLVVVGVGVVFWLFIIAFEYAMGERPTKRTPDVAKSGERNNMIEFIKKLLHIKPKVRLIYPDYDYYETGLRPTKRAADFCPQCGTHKVNRAKSCLVCGCVFSGKSG